MSASSITAPAPAPARLLLDTLRALAVARRALPIVIVCLPLILAQWTLSYDRLAGPLGVVMCVVFVTMAPYLWRRLGLTRGLGLAHLPRLLVYAGLGMGIVWGLGWGVPWVAGMGETFLTGTESMLVATALFWVGGWGLGRDIELEAGLAHERARVRDLEREAERAQLMALRSHLDPHFLFNTLNAIAEWCREDGETAERAILELSSLLRTMLDGVRLERWELSREVELANELFRLHRIRNPSLFTIESELPEDLGAALVPPMILLPLAENAMKHGPSSGHGGVVRLAAERDGERLCVVLENPGAYAGRREGGEGVAMVERRLRLAFEEGAQLELGSHGDGTRARVCMPLRFADAPAGPPTVARAGAERP